MALNGARVLRIGLDQATDWWGKIGVTNDTLL